MFSLTLVYFTIVFIQFQCLTHHFNFVWIHILVHIELRRRHICLSQWMDGYTQSTNEISLLLILFLLRTGIFKQEGHLKSPYMKPMSAMPAFDISDHPYQISPLGLRNHRVLFQQNLLVLPLVLRGQGFVQVFLQHLRIENRVDDGVCNLSTHLPCLPSPVEDTVGP